MADATIKIDADTRGVFQQINKIERAMGKLQTKAATANAALGRISGTAGRVAKVMAAASVAVGAFAAGAVVRNVISVTQEMERFRGQLTTYLGDQKLANYELDRLGKLANTLPQDLGELTNAFTIFTRMGIDTSNESLKAFSNIASANSKSMTQLAEAVADGMTGEFERFKEFGVKVTNESGKLVARLGEDIVAVGDTGAEVTKALVALGQEGGKFAGAAEAQAATLGTALSNLRGAAYQAADAIGRAGFAQALTDTVNQVSEMINTNPQLIDQISQGLTTAFLLLKSAITFVIENIDILAYAFIAFFAIGVAAKVLSIATIMGGALFKGIMLAAKAVAFLTMVAKRNPIIFAASVAIAGITAMTDAFGWFKDKAEEVGDALGGVTDEQSALGQEQSVFNKLLAEGSKIVDTLSNAVPNLKKAYEEARAEAQRYVEEARKKNVTMSDEEAQTMKLAKEQELQAKALERYNQEQENYRKTALAGLEQELALQQKRLDMYGQSESAITAEIAALEAVANAKKANNAVSNDTLATIYSETKARTEQLEAIKAEIELKDALAEVNRKATDVEAVRAGSSAFKRMNPAKEMKDTYEKELRGLEILRDNDAISEEEYLKTKLALHKEYENEIFELQKRQMEEKLRMNGVVNDEIIRMTIDQMEQVKMIQQGGIQGIQGVLGAMSNVFGAMGTQNKKAFEAHKALAIAQALISTYQAAAMALASAPWPFSLILVAGAVAAGLAQVNAIRSQQYSGRQLGGPVMGGEGYIVGESGPELFVPQTTGTIVPNRSLGSGGDVNVNFQIVANDTQGFDELLYNRRGLITQIISDAMVERGQRAVM